MGALIIATSKKYPNMLEETYAGKRPRLDYLELCKLLDGTYIDYDAPSLDYNFNFVRKVEEKISLDIYWAKKIAQKAKQENYEAVISLSERVGLPLAHMLDPDIKHICALHHPMSPKKLKLMKSFGTSHYFDMMLPLSRAEANALQQQLDISDGKIQPLHTAIDTDYYRPIHVKDNDEPFFLSIGLAGRDYPTLIRAMQGLPHINCQISATSAWANHKAGYEDMDIPSNVQSILYDHPLVIRKAYARSRFVVIPMAKQVSQWSAGSVSVLQPQAMGKPVITTKTPGLVDYVKDGETGILVEEGNPEALAEAIDYLWQNPHETARMGANARQWAVENFSLDRWLNKICAMIDELQ